jgi:hypothetical protein
MEIIGTWEVVSSPDFDDDVLEEDGPPYVTLRRSGDRLVGEYQIGLQSGDLDGRQQGDGSLIFTFEGMDEMDAVHGAATASLDGDRLILTLLYHQGDDYTYVCERR